MRITLPVCPTFDWTLEFCRRAAGMNADISGISNIGISGISNFGIAGISINGTRGTSNTGIAGTCAAGAAKIPSMGFQK